MNKQRLCAGLMLLGLPLFAHASCDEVKSQIDGKLKSNGVGHYTLTVVAADQDDGGAQVVGHCEGDKKILYSRGGGASASDGSAAEPASAAPASSAGGGRD